MEIEEKHNHNYHERFRPKSWSDLPLDLLISVFERLSFANFQRAKPVCSSWYSTSRQSVSKNQFPLLILFPKDNDDDDNNIRTCTLFNPEEEEDKLYKTKDLSLEFAKSVCIATYGSWLLMRDPLYNIYMLNLFTYERINLPSVELLIEDFKVFIASRVGMRYEGISLLSPVFWIDEKTKDYIVFSGFGTWCVVYAKKGDTSWNQIPDTTDCYNMVYKDHKLYFLSYPHGSFKIFDCRGVSPRPTLENGVHIDLFELRPRFRRCYVWSIYARKLVVNVTGEVFMVETWWRGRSSTWYLRVFKVYSSGSIIKKPERIYSLGEESMFLDQVRITFQANDGLFIRNSIYFIPYSAKNANDILIFNLETEETDPLLPTSLDGSSVQFSKAQWFLPSFTHTT